MHLLTFTYSHNMEASTLFSSSISPSIPVSARVQYYEEVISSMVSLILALMGIVFNLFILVVVRKNKTLQSSCFLLICGECLCSICFCIGDYIGLIDDGARAIGVISVDRWRAACFIIRVFPVLMGVHGNNVMINCVAIDRLFSVLCPIIYRSTGHRYAKMCRLFSFAFAVFSSLSGIISPPWGMMDTVKCLGPLDGMSRGYMAYHSMSSLTFCVLCVILYSAMFAAFYWRKKTILDPTAAQAFLKQQRACLPTVRLLMIMYGVFSVSPEILMSIISSSQSARVYAPHIIYYIGTMKTASALSPIVGLYFGSSQFRKCAKTLLGMKTGTGTVVPTAGAGGNRTGVDNEMRSTRRNTQVHTLGIVKV